MRYFHTATKKGSPVHYLQNLFNRVPPLRHHHTNHPPLPNGHSSSPLLSLLFNTSFSLSLTPYTSSLSLLPLLSISFSLLHSIHLPIPHSSSLPPFPLPPYFLSPCSPLTLSSVLRSPDLPARHSKGLYSPSIILYPNVTPLDH